MITGINASFARKFNTGLGQVTVNYLKALRKKRGEKKYILYFEEDLEFDFSDFKKRVFLPFYKRDDLIRKIWWEKISLPRMAEKDKCDEFLSIYQCPAVFSKRINHTMIVHDIIPKLFPAYLNNFRKKVYWKLTENAIKKADKIIAISKHTKRDLADYLNISKEKIEVRYIDVDSIYKREIPEEESRYILKKYDLSPGYIYNAGGLDRRKNVGGLIEAYAWLLKKEKNIPELVISGKLMPEMSPLITDVEKIAKGLKVGGKIKFLDFVPQEDMPALYKNAKLFVYPSFYEGFGLPILEAMNCGVPIAASGASSIPEVGGEAVSYFDPEDPVDIAKKMDEILFDEYLRNKLIEKGREQAKKFSWEEFIK
ncbi:MAG: glycosyltransferase family 1 protein [Candidatus Moranbacteria bacterium]|jgi:glycosyltransferase involved in cell wall biosynthesis|nr:glycosyltransferase family 1 protein [Candidatus Moranbacteria bacterium]MDD5652365.1 glycosyltransferase family 1 protein [Candidatus Moranbacteria bacterium]MDX9855283.1 glycosyltransferase family 1 protein [Candidatus Moranbacteria bacterium]